MNKIQVLVDLIENILSDKNVSNNHKTDKINYWVKLKNEMWKL